MGILDKLKRATTPKPEKVWVNVGTVGHVDHGKPEPWYFRKDDKEGKKITISPTKESGVILADLAVQYLVKLDDTGQEVFVFKKDKHLIEK